MARIKLCHGCGNENPEHASYCVNVNCGLDLEGIEVKNTDLEPIAVPAALAAPAENRLAAFMTNTAPTQFFLVFPWGEWKMQDRVIVGRDYRVSPFGQHLQSANHDQVSRVHAEFWIDDNELHLLHVGTHPIKVNDAIVLKGQRRKLSAGDTLDFANQLTVRVKI